MAGKNATPLNTACPICGKPASVRHRPFCSQRCATIDLARWLTGAYRVPTEDTPEEGEEDQSEDRR